MPASSRWVTPLGRWSRALTMRTMCKLVLDVDDPATARIFLRKFDATTGYLANIVSYSKPMWRPRGRFSIGAIAGRVVKQVDKIVDQTIAARRREGASGESPLDVLIRGQALHGYDDAFIRDNLVALLAAGYDTTGAAITWMLYWLSQTDAFADLRAKHGAGDTSTWRRFAMNACASARPVEIPCRAGRVGLDVTAVGILPDLATPGANGEAPMVCPCPHRVHHDPSVHENPERFEPERFVGHHYRPSEFMPFGAGRRFCLGAAAGTRLMDQVLKRLLVRGVSFKLPRGAFRPIRRNVTLWPGVFLYTRLRQQG